MEITVTSPFPFEAMPRVWRWVEQFRSKVSDDFAPKTLVDFIEAMDRSRDRQESWAVCVDGELGGLITFERLSPWLGTAHCIFKTDFQGKGVSLKALRVAFAEMFDTGIGKLSFYTFAGNLAIGSLVCNLGGKREGTLTGQTLIDGKPADILVYGLSKENFNATANIRGGRGSVIGSGVVPLGATQDDNHQQLDHADVHIDGAGAQRPASEPIEPTAD